MSDSATNDTAMFNTNSMSRLDVIRLIGNVLTDLDVLRAQFERGTTKRIKMDNCRDDIDAFERKLVRTVIKENTQKFCEQTSALKAVNENLRQTIKEVNKIAETLKALENFVEAAQKIAEVAP